MRTDGQIKRTGEGTREKEIKETEGKKVMKKGVREEDGKYEL
jgi:hypothetical protein